MADCYACFGSRKKEKKLNIDVDLKTEEKFKPRGKPQLSSGGDAIQTEIRTELVPEQLPSVDVPAASHSTVHTFTFKELKDATRNFIPETFIGEGGFGSVYKGQINNTGPLVAVKKLNPTGLQGDKEFLVEVLMLSLLRHSNLVSMFGYCAEGEQRALVYEFMPLGSLEDHLHGIKANKEALGWNTRMMIAGGTAKGLDYLHNEANPAVIYRDLKSANILLGEKFHPKLSDFGLAKFGPAGDDSHVSTRVMGTDGYCAPEYILTGKLTTKSDVYSFGVVLLELITGCRALDPTRGRGKQNLVEWLRPMLRDRRNYVQLVDPSLRGQFSESILRRAIEVASMCVREIANARPSMTDVVLALNYLSSRLHEGNADGEDGDDKQRMGGGDGFVNEIVSKDVDRVRAVAEAKMWGKSWRQKN